MLLTIRTISWSFFFLAILRFLRSRNPFLLSSEIIQLQCNIGGMLSFYNQTIASWCLIRNIVVAAPCCAQHNLSISAIDQLTLVASHWLNERQRWSLWQARQHCNLPRTMRVLKVWSSRQRSVATMEQVADWVMISTGRSHITFFNLSVQLTLAHRG